MPQRPGVVGLNSPAFSTPIESSHRNRVMNDIDLDYAPFECKKLKQRVIITSISLPAGYSKRTKAIVHVLEAFDCSQKASCGVLAEQGGHQLHNWRVCIHPELKKRNN